MPRGSSRGAPDLPLDRCTVTTVPARHDSAFSRDGQAAGAARRGGVRSRGEPAATRDRPEPLGWNRARRSLRSRRPRKVRTRQSMLDQLRQQIQTYLDELLGEADKLRRALVALGSRDGAATPSTSAAPSAAPGRAGRRVRSAPASRTATRKPARPRPSASTAAGSPSAAAGRAARQRAGRRSSRPAPGSTKTAVLQALAGGSAMTAGEVATATGLGRASVSTTLSKLAKQRRGDQGRSRLPARRPDTRRRASRRRRSAPRASSQAGSTALSAGVRGARLARSGGSRPDPRTGVSARRSLLSQLPSSATQHQGAQQWPPGP